MAAITEFDLSEDVMIDILARLPVKSLIRFKCVCKSWYALIKNPSFISKHLNSYAASRSVIKYCKGDTDAVYVSFLSSEAAAAEGELSYDVPLPLYFFGNDDEDSMSDDYYMMSNDDYISDVVFYGPCNGIICVVADYLPSCLLGNEMAFWNPATREIKRLLPYDASCNDEYQASIVQIGFGFDARSNDYKVVRMTAFEHRDTKWKLEEEPLIEVYSSITDSWRELNVFPPIPPTMNIYGTPSPYLNGFCYWCATDDNNYCHFVISFDFADEAFEKIPLPVIKTYDFTLVKFNETIAFGDNKEEDRFSVWVLNLKGDGEKKTWTKLYTFMYQCTRMLGFFRGGEALMLRVNYELGDDLVLCDPNTQQFKKLRVYDRNLHAGDSFQMVNYVESLVSFTGACKLDPTD